MSQCMYGECNNIIENLLMKNNYKGITNSRYRVQLTLIEPHACIPLIYKVHCVVYEQKESLLQSHSSFEKYI